MYYRHDSVCEVERLFNSITVMDVDIHIEHTLMCLQELQNSEHDIIDVAEAGRLCLFCMMHATFQGAGGQQSQ